jgi:hypothetical protein
LIYDAHVRHINLDVFRLGAMTLYLPLTIRATVTPSGNDAGNIFLAGVWVQGFPNSYPTANPPQ